MKRQSDNHCKAFLACRGNETEKVRTYTRWGDSVFGAAGACGYSLSSCRMPDCARLERYQGRGPDTCRMPKRPPLRWKRPVALGLGRCFPYPACRLGYRKGRLGFPGCPRCPIGSLPPHDLSLHSGIGPSPFSVQCGIGFQDRRFLWSATDGVGTADRLARTPEGGTQRTRMHRDHTVGGTGRRPGLGPILAYSLVRTGAGRYRYRIVRISHHRCGCAWFGRAGSQSLPVGSRRCFPGSSEHSALRKQGVVECLGGFRYLDACLVQRDKG